MPMFLSLLYIPGFSFGGFGGSSASLFGASPLSATCSSSNVSTGLSTLSQPTQNSSSFGATPFQVCGMMPQTASLHSASWTGESCSGDLIL